MTWSEKKQVKKICLLLSFLIIVIIASSSSFASGGRWERLRQWGRWVITGEEAEETQWAQGPEGADGARGGREGRGGDAPLDMYVEPLGQVRRASIPRGGGRGGSYHDFRGKCLGCHIKIPSPGERRPTLRKDVTVLCGKCHNQEDGLTHPVDVRPTRDIPGYLPLDWRGMVTCVTCHRAHKTGFGSAHLRTRARGQGFCVLCHSGLDENMHSVSGVSAHMGSVVKIAYGRGNRGAVRLDEVSIKCMSCHDATFGSESTVSNFDLFRSQHSNTTGLTHPVGVSYFEARRKYHGAYRPLKDLPPQIKLFGGRVGCGTCHSPYARGHAELVMNNYGSNLCLACHVK